MKSLFILMILLLYPAAACFAAYGVYKLGRGVGMSEFIAFTSGLTVLVGWYVGGLFLLDKNKED